MTRSQSLCSGAEQQPHFSHTPLETVYPTDSSAELAYASFEQLTVGQLYNTSSKSMKTNVRYQPLARVESSDEKCIQTQVIDSKDGERGRNRTFNLLIKSQLLCQLSYAPHGGMEVEGH
jgi:hypothetical protein